MGSSYTLTQRIIAYCMTMLLVVHLVFGNIGNGVVQAEGSSPIASAVTLKIDNVDGQELANSVIRSNQVMVYYAFDTTMYPSTSYGYQYTLTKGNDTEESSPVDLEAEASGTFEVRHEELTDEDTTNMVYTLCLEAKDSEGNVVEDSKTEASFMLGNHASTTTLSVDKAFVNDTVNITYVADKGEETEKGYRKVEKIAADGTATIVSDKQEIVWEEGSAAFTWQSIESFIAETEENTGDEQVLEQGRYKITYWLEDAGDTELVGSKQEAEFVIDTQNPTASLVCNDEEAMATDQISCTLTVTDENFDSGRTVLYVTRLSADGEETTYSITSDTFTDFQNGVGQEIVFEEDGNYKVYAEVKDKADNTTDTEPVSFIVDDTEPAVTIDAGAKVDGGIYSTESEEMPLLIKVTDINLCADSCQIIVTRDGVPIDVECSWSGTDTEQNATLSFGEDFEDGVYKITVTAKDKLNNQGEEEFTFIIDNTSVSITNFKVTYEDGSVPNAVVNDGESVLYFKNTAKVHFDAREKNYTGSQIYYNVTKDGAVVTNDALDMAREQESFNYTYTEEGSYHANVYGKDVVGNQSDEQQCDFVIDKQAPILDIKQVVDGVESNIAENQLFSVADNRALRFYVSEKYHNPSTYVIRIERKTDLSIVPETTVISGSSLDWTTVSGTNQIYFENRTYFEKEGQYTVRFLAEDLAGNKATPKIVTFYIDSIAPIITQTSAVTEGSYYNENVKFQYDIYEFNYATTTASITVNRTLDGVTYTTTDTLELKAYNTSFEYLCREEGAYEITVVAKDKAGNEAVQQPGSSQKGYTIRFVVDKTKPELSFLGVTDGQKTKNSVELTINAKDRNHDFSQYSIYVIRSDASGELESFSITGNVASDYDVNNGWTTSGYTTQGQNVFDALRELSFDKEGMYRVSVNGKDLAGNEALEKTITFTIDYTAPVISSVTYTNSQGMITPKHQSIYSSEAILVEFAVTDAVVGVNTNKVYVTIGAQDEKNEATVMYPAHKSIGNYYYVYVPTDLEVMEFTGQITIWAQDLLGNESSVASANIVYTVAKPNINMECDIDYSQWTKQDVTFHTTVTDNMAGIKQIVYKVNGKEVHKISFNYEVCTYQYDVTASESASKVTGYAVTVEATNNCGVTQTVKKQVYIDKDKPTVKLSGVENGAHYRSNQLVTTSVDDISYNNTKTVYYVTRTLDGKKSAMSLAVFSSEKYEDSCTRKLLREGEYKIYAITTDGAGNQQKSNTLSFVIDKTAPVLNISGATNGSMSGNAVTIDMECVESFYATNDINIQVEKEIDGKTSDSVVTGFPKNAKKASMSQTFSDDGTYTVTMTATDKAGNVATAKTLTFSVDGTKPEIRVLGTDNYQMWKNATNVQFVVEDSYYAGNEVTITGTRTDIDGNVEAVSLPKFVSAAKVSSLQQTFEKDGFYEFLITAKDQAGNSESKSIHFTIDRTLPKIKGVAHYQGGYYQSFQLAKSLDEIFYDLTVITYRMLLNGVEYNGTDVIETEGKYDLYIEVEDELGHINTETLEFIIDHTPPKVIFSGVKEDEIVTDGGVVTLALVNSDDYITGIRVNGKEYDVNTREFAYSEYGAYHIEVDCEDQAGNTVTRELRFVYNNPVIIAGIATAMVVIIVGTCIWLFVRARKREKDEL